MKKITLQLAAFSMAVFMIFAFFACEKEGVYNPKQKIKRVYEEKDAIKVLAEEWTWNKNLLEKIDYYVNNKIDHTERYSYEKNRVVKVEGNYYYYKVSYDGSMYKQVDLYYVNRLSMSYVFEYTGSKISKTTITIYGEYIPLKSGFLSSIFSKETISTIGKLTAEDNRSKGSGPQIITITFLYDGDNVKEQVLSFVTEYFGQVYSTNIKMIYDKYDTKVNNPFYKFLSEGIATTSKNLPLEVREISTTVLEGFEPDVSTTRIQYTYSLQKNFPTEIQEKIIDEDNNMEIFTIWYEYQN